MKNFTLPLIAVALLMGAAPTFAAGIVDCTRDVKQFDAALKTSTASEANKAAAIKLRDHAHKECTTKGEHAHADVDADAALRLLGVRT